MADESVLESQSSSVPDEIDPIPNFHLIYQEYVDEDTGSKVRVESYFTSDAMFDRVKALFLRHGESLDIEIIQGTRWVVERPKKSLILSVKPPDSETLIFNL